MTGVAAVRSLADDVTLAITRVDEAGSALRSATTPGAARTELERYVADGASFDDPRDAVLALAEQGNRAMWDAFTKTDAAASILGRAAAAARDLPAGPALREAHGAASGAAGALDGWIASGGTSTSLDDLAASVGPKLAEARRLAVATLTP